jgi:hypothetical protein
VGKALSSRPVFGYSGGFWRVVRRGQALAGIFVAMLMASVCVLVHFEAFILVERVRERIKSFRFSLLAAWFGLLLAHVVEIWLYAGAYWVCERLGMGTLHGMVNNLDYAYYSAVVYTTLGFGDIIPSDDLRMLTGSEGLVGLCLIAWSATITYSHTQLILRRRSQRH